MAEAFDIDRTTVLIILGMAAATYATRLAGYWLVGRLPTDGPLAGALDAAPAAILIALVTPTVLASGWIESAAAIATVATARRLPMVAAVLVGIGCVAGLRVLTAGVQ